MGRPPCHWAISSGGHHAPKSREEQGRRSAAQLNFALAPGLAPRAHPTVAAARLDWRRNSLVARTLPVTPLLAGLCENWRKLLKMRHLAEELSPIIPGLYGQSPANKDFAKAIIFLYEETFHAISNL